MKYLKKNNLKIVLDTNLIIYLSQIYYEEGFCYKNSRKNLKIHYLNEVLGMIIKGKIDIILTPTILFEIEKLSEKFNGVPTKFLKEFGQRFYTINFESEEEKNTYIKNVKKLACIYCNIKTNDKEEGNSEIFNRYIRHFEKSNSLKEMEEPFFKIYNKEPAFDAYIMAEASLCNLNLLTLDKHFLRNNLPQKIQKFNQEYFKIKSKPWSLEDFYIQILKKSPTHSKIQNKKGNLVSILQEAVM